MPTRKPSLAARKEQAAAIVARMKEIYPDAACALEYHGDPWKLLVMGRLSAQCTDRRVNIVCEELFTVFPTCRAMAEGDLAEIERIVKPCGLYRTKAANIRDASKMLIDDFGGEIPRTMDELLTLPGVGRKIANLLLGDVYHLPAVVCDTHCIRICGRLGFYPETQKDPARTETILREVLAPEEGSDFCHRLVWFGRETCTARAPRCDGCPMRDLCRHAGGKQWGILWTNVNPASPSRSSSRDGTTKRRCPRSWTPRSFRPAAFRSSIPAKSRRSSAASRKTA